LSIFLSDRLEVATRLGFTEDEATTLALSDGRRALREDDLKLKDKLVPTVRLLGRRTLGIDAKVERTWDW
jgi:hypothetical protein